MPEVAYTVGFHSQSAFISAFKKNMQCLPSEYKIKRKEEKAATVTPQRLTFLHYYSVFFKSCIFRCTSIPRSNLYYIFYNTLLSFPHHL